MWEKAGGNPRFVSFDNHYDQKNVSHETEISHVTQNDFGQSDISRKEVLKYGLANRKEKGNGF